MAIKKIGRVWRTKKQGTDVIMSGELIDGARIGIIRAKDKDKKVIPDTYDVIAFKDDTRPSTKASEPQIPVEKF